MLTWPKLQTPPVITAVFQIMFDSGGLSLSELSSFDNEYRKILPLRHDNIAANIDLADTTFSLGVSKVSGISNTKIESYTYYTKDQKTKFVLAEKYILFIDENKYESWDNFSNMIFRLLTIAKPILEKVRISRTSIRFINKFDFDSFVPTDYFKTLVTQTEEHSVPYPLTKFSFNLRLNVDSNIVANVNQTSEKLPDRFIYLFDIDVLDYSNLLFDLDSLNTILTGLRKVKNEIFFSNITDKLIQRCN